MGINVLLNLKQRISEAGLYQKLFDQFGMFIPMEVQK